VGHRTAGEELPIRFSKAGQNEAHQRIGSDQEVPQQTRLNDCSANSGAWASVVFGGDREERRAVPQGGFHELDGRNEAFHVGCKRGEAI
jgi:hypothetical protein